LRKVVANVAVSGPIASFASAERIGANDGSFSFSTLNTPVRAPYCPERKAARVGEHCASA
jgi:hypothetical protein